MLFERWTGAKILERWMPKFLPKRYLNYKLNWTETNIKRRLVKKDWIWALKWEKAQIRLNLPPLLFRILCSSLSHSWWPLLSLFSRVLCISFPHCSSLDIRLFGWRLFLFSFAFLSPYSAYFSVLSNSLSRFSRLALRLLLLACCFLKSLSFFPVYFHPKLFLQELEL